MNHPIILHPEEAGFLLFQTSNSACSLIVFGDGRGRLKTPSECRTFSLPPALHCLLRLLFTHEDMKLSVRASMSREPLDDGPPVVVIPSIGSEHAPLLFAWCAELFCASEAWHVLRTHQDIDGVILEPDKILMRNGDTLSLTDHLQDVVTRLFSEPDE